MKLHLPHLHFKITILFHLEGPGKATLIGVFTPHRLKAKYKELQERYGYSDTQLFLNFLEYKLFLNNEFER